MPRTEGLDTPVRFVRGVGPSRAETLREIGIETVRDLLDFYPRRYRFFDPVGSIAELDPDQQAAVVGQIETVSYRRFPRPPRIAIVIADDTGTCQARWFNCGYLADRFQSGKWIRVRGKVARWRGGLVFNNPQFEIFDQCPGQADESFSQPVYPLQERFGKRLFSKLTRAAMEMYGGYIDDWLTPDRRKARNLVPRRRAYQMIHDPETEAAWQDGRKRLAYDELFFMQLAMLLARRKRVGTSAARFEFPENLDERIRRRFPFELTGSQNRAVGDIVADLQSARPMCRLVQGDVGCGKTVVALYAALVTVANRRQVVFMAPTEILAHQHHRKITEYLAGSKVRIALLAGKTPKQDRDRIVAQAGAGEIDILIGTHALIEQDIVLRKLGLVIIDEQHKFGVHQRAMIKSKGADPHYLVMTATPIPRSLALTVFGDLDLTLIDESPPGRVPVKTRMFDPEQEPQVWEFVKNAIRRGDQAYVVYPLLEESDRVALKSARAESRRLADEILSSFRVGLIHGRMKPADKQRVMTEFRRRKIDVLVATVVIEVGIDVPDANVLVVEHADRFGLAQLHQLRGRIGRAGGQGHCLLVAKGGSASAQKRLGVLLETTDGFKIAEQDLRIRGPGQFFGTAQHGLPELKVADLIDDYQLMLKTRTDVEQLLRDDPGLERHRLIRQEVIRRLGRRLKLIDAA